MTPQHAHQFFRDARIRNRAHIQAHAAYVPASYTKTYERFPTVSLPEPGADIMLKEALQKRRSHDLTVTASIAPPSLNQLGTLFGLAMHAHDERHRPYPSGGALYPIEAYVVAPLGEQRPSCFHYHPQKHHLERLWKLSSEQTVGDLLADPLAKDVPAGIFLTAYWNRSAYKYADFAYYLTMLEAGHIGQNLALAAVAAGMHLRPLGGFDDRAVEHALDIDPHEEQVVYAFTLAS